MLISGVRKRFFLILIVRRKHEKKKKGDAPIFSDGNGSACLIVTKDDIDEKLLHTFFLSMMLKEANEMQ